MRKVYTTRQAAETFSSQYNVPANVLQACIAASKKVNRKPFAYKDYGCTMENGMPACPQWCEMHQRVNDHTFVACHHTDTDTHIRVYFYPYKRYGYVKICHGLSGRWHELKFK